VGTALERRVRLVKFIEKMDQIRENGSDLPEKMDRIYRENGSD
jgi:hypothetical protein